MFTPVSYTHLGGFIVKKIIGLLLVLSVFCPLGINVFAQDTLDGKITLTHFLGVDAVSYTHLDVYKRQAFMRLRWNIQH